jgi:hypothetical protein
MLQFLKPWLLLIVVGLGMLVAASWSFRPLRVTRRLGARFEVAHRLAMAVCACLGVWAFTLFGDLHDHGAFGHQNFHAHDCFHYYFGSKYLKEWGYDGMYLATIAALEEVGREEPRKAIQFERIRDLRGSARFLRRDEFLPLTEPARARFTPERWTLLKKDLSFLREKTMNNDWWKGVVLDSGFNPPPSYAVLTSAVSNRIPFTEGTWKWLGALDFILLGIGVGAIAHALGVVPGLFTLVILGNTPITTYNWTGGSFLRQGWVFFLMLGLAFLARRRWYKAGAALGASTAAVLFPAVFLVGSMVPLGYQFYRRRSHNAVLRVALAAAVAIAVLFGLSLLRFGIQPWIEWRLRIGAHDASFFDNHIGIRKIVTFAPEIAPQAFGAGDSVYPDWNHALVLRAQRGQIVDFVLKVLLSVWTIAAGLRARPAEAALVVGSGLLVLWMMPASYYTIYIGVFAAVMLANRRTDLSRKRFAAICTVLLFAILLQKYEHDRIVQHIWLSAGWLLCIFVLSSLYWIEHSVVPQALLERRRTVTAVGIAALLLLGIGAVQRDVLHSANFLPSDVLAGARVADMLDVGPKESEQAHAMDIGEDLRVPRHYLDTYGYRVSDECGILRKGRTLKYQMQPIHREGRLVIRTDSFYKGDLLTTINGRSLPPVTFDPRQTLFMYLQIPVPGDLGDGPLQVEQTTTATDIGFFTVWLLEDPASAAGTPAAIGQSR